MVEADLWRAPPTVQSTDATPSRWPGWTRWIAESDLIGSRNHKLSRNHCWFFVICKISSFLGFSPGASPGLLSDWRCKVANSLLKLSNKILSNLFPLPSLSNCPSGNAINIDYNGCNSALPSLASFQVCTHCNPIQIKILQCLGDWSGPGGQRYLGLLHQPPHSDSSSPRYICAVRFSGESEHTVSFSMLQMYKAEEGTGRIRLSMSKDSTCHLLAEDRSAPWPQYQNQISELFTKDI